MTREEAIKVLEKQFDKSCGNYRYQNAEKLDFEDALWMAISALRQQDVADKDVGKNEPLTNAQKIRSMSDKELAKIIEHELGCPVTGNCEKMSRDCKACWLDWLQQPAEEDDHE